MNIFRIVSFIENIHVRFSGSVRLNKEFFCMRDIMNRLLRDLEPGNNLTICIDGNRGFQEAFPGLSCSPGIVGTCIGTGKSG
jgi:hypothetical protein